MVGPPAGGPARGYKVIPRSGDLQGTASQSGRDSLINLTSAAAAAVAGADRLPGQATQRLISTWAAASAAWAISCTQSGKEYGM